MDLESLKSILREDKEDGLEPFLLVGTAGTTDCGAVDPLDSLASLAERYNMWFHVDAAYGGFFLLSPEVAEDKFRGIERSDSVTMDPHKGMFVPFGTGAIVVREGWRLAESNRALSSSAAAAPKIPSSKCSGGGDNGSGAAYLQDTLVQVELKTLHCPNYL